MLSGGYIKDIPEPHVRRWPSNGRLEVTVYINSWVGYSPGAKHWYSKVEESHNPIWNSDEQMWQQAWDDKDGRGQSFRNEFAPDGSGIHPLDQARAWSLEIVKEHFGDSDLWKIHWDIMDDDRPMPYEGD